MQSSTIIHNTKHANFSKGKVYVYTSIVYAILIAILLFKWISNPAPVEIVDDVIEVNLGNVDDAFGNQAPLAVNSSSVNTEVTAEENKPQIETKPETAPQQPSQATNNTTTVETEDPDVAALIKKENNRYAKSIEEAKKIPKKEAKNNTVKPKKAVEKPKPKPKPIAVFRGNKRNDNVENNASNYDSYGKRNTSQGIGKGSGDMGNTTGSISSNNYGSSISVVGGLGNRRVLSFPKIMQDFDYDGIVYIRASFNRDGRLLSAQQDIKNSTTTRPHLVNIALQQVKKISLNSDKSSAYEQVVIFRFVFKLEL